MQSNNDSNMCNSKLSELFDKAASYVASGSFDTSTDERLFLYARYKQAIEGPCSISKPSGLFNIEAKKKWQSWHALKQMSKEAAMQQYVSKVTEVDPLWESNPNSKKRGWAYVSSMPKEEEPGGERTVFDFAQDNETEALRALPCHALHCADDNGMTPLHWASDRGHVAATQFLISQSTRDQLNVGDGEGQTALHYAASCGHADIISLLLQKCADFSLVDHDGLSPVDCTEDPVIKTLFK